MPQLHVRRFMHARGACILHWKIPQSFICKITKYFRLGRIAHQHELISAYLFILALEILFLLLKTNSNINAPKISLRKKCPYSEFSGLYFPAFGLNTERYEVRKNTNQKNSEYGHFSRSVFDQKRRTINYKHITCL